MAYYFKLYVISLGAFFAIDIIWLGFVARTFYRSHLGFLMAQDVNWLPAIIFYLLFIIGIVVFVLVPGLKEDSLKTTLVRGALFGLITYSTYDLTNHATVKDWPVIVTVVDLVWGIVLTLSVSLVGFIAGKWIN